MSEVRRRHKDKKAESSSTPADEKTDNQEVKRSKKKTTLGWLGVKKCPIDLLLIGALQGLMMGLVVGGLLGVVMWRSAVAEMKQFAIQKPAAPDTMPFNQPAAPAESCPQCQTCPKQPVCDKPVPANCIDETSEFFMKREADVENYHNPRMVPLQGIFVKEQIDWILEQGKAVRKNENSAVAFGRQTKSWSWIYDRIHSAVLEQNKKTWKYALPKDYNSQLVDNIHFIAYNNETQRPHEQNWAVDMGQQGHKAKRVLSALMFLNDDYEGGDFVTQISKEEYTISPTKPGMMWVLQSYVMKKKRPVTSGTQYMLHYWVERY